MEVNWYVIGILAVVVVALVAYLVKTNIKDEREFETFLNKNEHGIDKERSEINDAG